MIIVYLLAINKNKYLKPKPMKKVKITHLVAVLFCSAVLLFSSSQAQAQYRTGAGLLIDLGDGATLVGPHIKHFFSANSAIEGGVLFGSNITSIQGIYQYHQAISGAEGLQWYLGAGPAFSFANSDSDIALVGTGGLDYKISGAPIALSFDWRPRLTFYDGGSDFLPGRFGLGFRFVFN